MLTLTKISATLLTNVMLTVANGFTPPEGFKLMVGLAVQMF